MISSVVASPTNQPHGPWKSTTTTQGQRPESLQDVMVTQLCLSHWHLPTLLDSKT